MGIPLAIINRTRKQYTTFCGSGIGANKLSEFLPLYIRLITEGTWDFGDEIVIKNKHMECAKDNKPEK